jgi:hypothetical protein
MNSPSFLEQIAVAVFRADFPGAIEDYAKRVTMINVEFLSGLLQEPLSPERILDYASQHTAAGQKVFSELVLRAYSIRLS